MTTFLSMPLLTACGTKSALRYMKCDFKRCAISKRILSSDTQQTNVKLSVYSKVYYANVSGHDGAVSFIRALVACIINTVFSATISRMRGGKSTYQPGTDQQYALATSKPIDTSGQGLHTINPHSTLKFVYSITTDPDSKDIITRLMRMCESLYSADVKDDIHLAMLRYEQVLVLLMSANLNIPHSLQFAMASMGGMLHKTTIDQNHKDKIIISFPYDGMSMSSSTEPTPAWAVSTILGATKTLLEEFIKIHLATEIPVLARPGVIDTLKYQYLNALHLDAACFRQGSAETGHTLLSKLVKNSGNTSNVSSLYRKGTNYGITAELPYAYVLRPSAKLPDLHMLTTTTWFMIPHAIIHLAMPDVEFVAETPFSGTPPSIPAIFSFVEGTQLPAYLTRTNIPVVKDGTSDKEIANSPDIATHIPVYTVNKQGTGDVETAAINALVLETVLPSIYNDGVLMGTIDPEDEVLRDAFSMCDITQVWCAARHIGIEHQHGINLLNTPYSKYLGALADLGDYFLNNPGSKWYTLAHKTKELCEHIKFAEVLMHIREIAGSFTTASIASDCHRAALELGRGLKSNLQVFANSTAIISNKAMTNLICGALIVICNELPPVGELYNHTAGSFARGYFSSYSEHTPDYPPQTKACVESWVDCVRELKK